MEHASRDIRHKAIRAALRIAFPATKFSVTGSRGTGYGWSRVNWTHGALMRRAAEDRAEVAV